MKKLMLLIGFICLIQFDLFAQEKHAFWQDVQIIKEYDKMYKPPVHPILFVGSSSIRKWDNLQLDFGKYNVLNRGIGGAVINDISFYLNDIVFAYEPRQIVLYVGENDVVNEANTADTIVNRTIRLYSLIRAKMPDVPLVYISMKPSPSREKFVQKVIDANGKIKAYLENEKNTAYVDIFPLMLDKKGKMRTELFVNDMLHMQPKGYAIWKKAVKPYLLKYKKPKV